MKGMGARMGSRWLAAIGMALMVSTLPALSAAGFAADAYPTKPIRLIIPFPPGGSNDIVGRLMATKLSERLGKNVIVDNRAGAGGVLGAEVVANSAPDGYTLLFISASYAINPALYKLRYDHDRSFVPIAGLGSGPNVLAIHPGVPANSVKELLALAKSQPGRLICASSGVGSFQHLSSELFKMLTGADFMIVQFKGGGPAMIAPLGGHSQFSLGALIQTLPYLKPGKLKALGVGGKKRSSMLPDVPTIAEAGVPGYEATNWWGMLAPAGTPKPILERLYRELEAVMGSADTKKLFADQGAEAELMPSAEFSQFIKSETLKWGKVVRQANIKVDE